MDSALTGRALRGCPLPSLPPERALFQASRPLPEFNPLPGMPSVSTSVMGGCLSAFKATLKAPPLCCLPHTLPRGRALTAPLDASGWGGPCPQTWPH